MLSECNLKGIFQCSLTFTQIYVCLKDDQKNKQLECTPNMWYAKLPLSRLSANVFTATQIVLVDLIDLMAVSNFIIH